MHQLTKNLHEIGRALEGMPALDDITVGGAIATGAHGSSLTRLTTISSQIVALTVVDGRGNVRNISEEQDEEAMNAFRVNLGLLGIIYEVTIRTVPQYKVHTENHQVADTILLENVNQLVEEARNSDFYRFFWFPTAEQLVISRSNIVFENTSKNCETHFIPEVSPRETALFKRYVEFMQEYKLDFGLYLLQLFSLRSLSQPVLGKTPLFTVENDNGTICSRPIGFSHKMLASSCKDCPWKHENASEIKFEESAVAIPLSELGAAVETIGNIIKASPAHFYFTGILFRFLKPSSSLLGIDRNRESVGIEWVLAGRTDRLKKARSGLAATQALVQALVIII